MIAAVFLSPEPYVCAKKREDSEAEKVSACVNIQEMSFAENR